MIYVIVGRSCSGKNTLQKELLGMVKKMRRIVPYTTRPKRNGEVDGEDYKFMDEKDHNVLATRGFNFIYNVSFATKQGEWHYFLPMQSFSPANTYVTIATLDAAKQIAERFKDTCIIYLNTSVKDALHRAWLYRVSDDDDALEAARRLLSDYDDFEDAVDIIKKTFKRYIIVENEMETCDVIDKMREIDIGLTKEGENTILFKNNGGIKPVKAHKTDAGYDLFAPERVVAKAGEITFVDTKVSTVPPDGMAAFVVQKSGLYRKKGIMCLGLVDAEYTGNIGVTLYNAGKEDVVFERGDKVSQIVFLHVPEVRMVEVDDLPETNRGNGGFGSTGK